MLAIGSAQRVVARRSPDPSPASGPGRGARAVLAVPVVLLAASSLASPALAGPPYWLPSDFRGNFPRVAVAVGDSITQGVSNEATCANPSCIVDRPYPAALEGRLQARHPGFLVRNRGRGGEATDGGLQRLASVLAADRPALVLIMEGTNDTGAGVEPARIVQNLRAMVRLAKANAAIPILGAIPPNFRDDPEARAGVAAVNAMLPAVAAEEGVRFVDTFSPLNDPALYGPLDLHHPNQRGYDVLGAAWQPALEEAIAAARPLLAGAYLASTLDYDGDGRADVAVYRGETGEWLIRRSSDGGLLYLPWGSPFLGDRPVPANYTDGSPARQADVAVYRGVSGEWFIRRASDGGLTYVAWGAPVYGDLPVPGDYDGDGRADVAVYRRATGEWFIRRSSDGGLTYLNWGAPTLGDVPVPGDYDGDGTTDIAVYRASTGEWFIRRSSDGALVMIAWGSPFLGDVPVPASYTVPGVADIAVYRTSTGEWFIRRASDGGLTRVPWGAPTLGDLPVPGRYTGGTPMSRTDVAVYRASTGEWFVRRATDAGLTQVPWGGPSLGDVPTSQPPPVP